MIQSNQLRTGNLVFGPLDEIMKIVLIDDTCDPCYLYAHCINGSGHGQNGFEPIPITKEWLLKFGFKYSNKKHCYLIRYNFRDSYKIFKIESCIGGSGLVNNISYIKYVHQLQNIYYALTQQELELK